MIAVPYKLVFKYLFSDGGVDREKISKRTILIKLCLPYTLRFTEEVYRNVYWNRPLYLPQRRAQDQFFRVHLTLYLT